MSWDYRILRTDHPSGEITFGIHEVYYDSEGKPNACSVDPMDPHGETVEELREDINAMLKAFDKPVLDYSLFGEK